MKRYVWNLLIAVDQFGNALTGGFPDETISSRLGKWKLKNPDPPWYDPRHWLERARHWIDPNHAVDAIEHDEGNPTPE